MRRPLLDGPVLHGRGDHIGQFHGKVPAALAHLVESPVDILRQRFPHHRIVKHIEAENICQLFVVLHTVSCFISIERVFPSLTINRGASRARVEPSHYTPRPLKVNGSLHEGILLERNIANLMPTRPSRLGFPYLVYLKRVKKRPIAFDKIVCFYKIVFQGPGIIHFCKIPALIRRTPSADGVAAVFAGADADAVGHVQDENLPVADLAGAGRGR
jgi:hypothetical protein